MSVPVKHRCAKVSSNTCTNFKMATRCPELESETESQNDNDFDTSSESERSTVKPQKNTTGVGGGGGVGYLKGKIPLKQIICWFFF